MIQDDLQIEIKDSLFDPDQREGKMGFKRSSSSKNLYKVWIYLDGRDIGLVDKVTYKLHPSFRKPIHHIRRDSANSLFKLPIWTWGIFHVYAEVKTIDGGRYNLAHKLEYFKDLPSAKIRMG